MEDDPSKVRPKPPTTLMNVAIKFGTQGPIEPEYGSLWFSAKLDALPERRMNRRLPFNFDLPVEIDTASTYYAPDILEVLARPETETETLFSAFYFMPACSTQAAAAALLHDRGWRWCISEQRWMRPVSQPHAGATGYIEAATWQTFSLEKWDYEEVPTHTVCIEEFAPRPPVAVCTPTLII